MKLVDPEVVENFFDKESDIDNRSDNESDDSTEDVATKRMDDRIK